MLSPEGSSSDPFFSPNIKKEAKNRKIPGNILINSPSNNNKSTIYFKNLQNDKTKDNFEENKYALANNVPISPLQNCDKIKFDEINKQNNMESFKVYVRIRPVNAKELTITNKKPNTFSKSVQKIDDFTVITLKNCPKNFKKINFL